MTASGYATSVLDELLPRHGTYDVGPIYVLRPVAVTGVVSDESGAPIVGAEVRAVPGEATWSRVDYADLVPVATTDGDGRYRFESMPPGIATLGVSATGRGDVVLSGVVLRDDGANEYDVVLRQERRLAGIVTDPDGAPIPGAIVRAESSAFVRGPSVTDAAGRFVIRGLDHDWNRRWNVVARGFVSVEIATTHGRMDDEWVALRRSGSLEIEVRRPGGPPPRIHEVRLRDSSPPDYCGLAQQMFWKEVGPTDLTVDVIGPSTWRIHHGGIAFHTPGAVTRYEVLLDSGARLRDAIDPPDRIGHARVTIDAPLSGKITGWVVRPDGEPLVNTTVMLNHWTVYRPHRSAVTDDEGTFTFEDVAPGDLHSVTVDNDVWRGTTRRITVREGQETDGVEVLVEPAPLIEGTITFVGRPPGEARVLGLGEFQNHQVARGGAFGIGRCDAAGRFRIVPQYSRRFTVVPKRPATPADGGYRRFRCEFPETPRDAWPWQVRAPEPGGVVRVDIDFTW